MNENEARAQAGGVPRADRRCGPPHRGAAERAHARGGRDRPRQARSAASGLRAEARRPGFRQYQGVEPRAAQPGSRARHLRAHHRRDAQDPAAAKSWRTETSNASRDAGRSDRTADPGGDRPADGPGVRRASLHRCGPYAARRRGRHGRFRSRHLRSDGGRQRGAPHRFAVQAGQPRLPARGHAWCESVAWRSAAIAWW